MDRLQVNTSLHEGYVRFRLQVSLSLGEWLNTCQCRGFFLSEAIIGTVEEQRQFIYVDCVGACRSSARVLEEGTVEADLSVL